MNPLLLNSIYDSLVLSLGDKGARSRALSWEEYLSKRKSASDSLNLGDAESFLRDLLSRGIPGKSDLFISGKKDIASAARKATDTLRQGAASSGLNAPALFSNAYAEIYGEEADNLRKLRTGIETADTDIRRQAIAGLLGIESVKQQAVSDDRAFELDFLEHLLSRRNSDIRLSQVNKDDFWNRNGGDVLKYLLNGASSIFSFLA